MPVTLLLGELNDGEPPYGTAFEKSERALPQARRVVLPGQGHSQAPDPLANYLTEAVAGSR